jgi:ribosomal protein S18 acetylase RimI-like enzyme
MLTNQKQGLIKKQGLTQTELAEIKLLAETCNVHGRLDLKLNWEMLEARESEQMNDFLYYQDGILVGFLALFIFNPPEVEISGMVHPDYRRRGIFTAMYQEAKAECQRRGSSTILLIVEQVSSAGQAFARSLEAGYDFSEYKMVLEEPKMPARLEERLRFRPATSDDLLLRAHITARAFDLPESEVIQDSAEKLEQVDRGLYVGELDGLMIGKVDVLFSEYEGYIHGFGVLPEYQGRGYGRQILARTIQEILARGKSEITIEVSVTNKNALSLYQSCGFKETNSYDYYRVFI